MLGGGGPGGFAGISLVNISKLHPIAGYLLHLFGELVHLSAILLIGGCDMQGKQIAQGVHRGMYFRSFAPFGSVVSSPRPDSGVDWSVRLSTTMAVGNGLRPENSRKSMRKSSTITSKQPAAIQRRVCW